MGDGALYAVALLFAVNVIAFLAFGLDKWRSIRSKRRVSEAALLAWAFWGGFPGAKLGQHFFRHKTRKKPFARRLNRIGVLQAGLIGLAIAYSLSGGTPWRDLDWVRSLIGAYITT